MTKAANTQNHYGHADRNGSAASTDGRAYSASEQSRFAKGGSEEKHAPSDDASSDRDTHHNQQREGLVNEQADSKKESSTKWEDQNTNTK